MAMIKERIWLVLLVFVGCLVAALVAHAQADADDTELIAVLGKIKDLNEKDPQLVRAEFKDQNGVVVEEEKLYVRWERSHKDQGRWIVLSAFCPHSKCKVVFSPEERIYRDPCYGSEYDLDGRVKKGPSKKPLPDYSSLVFEDEDSLKLRREPTAE